MAHLADPKRANLVLFGGPFDGRVHEMPREDLAFHYTRGQHIVFPIQPEYDTLRGYRGASDSEPKPGMMKTAAYKIFPVESFRERLPIVFYYGEFYG
jgi:hypothetical protein